MDLWTALACLVANPNCKSFKRFGDEGKGAYVNIVAWASSEEEFGNRVRQAATDLDCILEELEGIQLLERRLKDPDYPEELIDLRVAAQRQADDIVFGEFQIWVQDDSN